MRRHVLTGLGLAVMLVALGGTRAAERAPFGARADTEVVVSLDAPPLARAGAAGAARLDSEQRAFRRALTTGLPDAHVRWRYRLVVDGYSVVLPKADVSKLRTLPGVRDVYASASYAPQAVAGPVDEIGAPGIWGPGLASAGQGVKIGIIDSGVDQTHPYFTRPATRCRRASRRDRSSSRTRRSSSPARSHLPARPPATRAPRSTRPRRVTGPMWRALRRGMRTRARSAGPSSRASLRGRTSGTTRR